MRGSIIVVGNLHFQFQCYYSTQDDIFIFTSPLQIHSSLKPIVMITGLEMTACQKKTPEIVDKSGHIF